MREQAHSAWIQEAMAAGETLIQRMADRVARADAAEARMWRAPHGDVDEGAMLRGGSVGLFREVLGEEEGDAFAHWLASRVEQVKRTEGEVPPALRHELAKARTEDFGRAAFLVGAIRSAARDAERAYRQIATEPPATTRTQRHRQRRRITRRLAHLGDLAVRVESQSAILDRLAAPYRPRPD